jgi:DNA-binding MarR family transcriptional regulator
MKQTYIENILENLFVIMPVFHRKLLRMDMGGVTGDLTRLHLGIMGRLHHHSMTTSELARETVIPRPQMTHLIDHLVAAGIVDRQPDATDRRVINLVLTENGLIVLQDLKHKVHDRIRKELSGLSSDELAEMSGALESLRRIGTKL